MTTNRMLSDSHLDDHRSDRELQAAQAATDEHDAAVMKRATEIIGNEADLSRLAQEYPMSVATLVRSMMGETHNAEKFRKGIRQLAEEMADDEIQAANRRAVNS